MCAIVFVYLCVLYTFVRIKVRNDKIMYMYMYIDLCQPLLTSFSCKMHKYDVFPSKM